MNSNPHTKGNKETQTALPDAMMNDARLALLRVRDYVREWKSGLTSAQETMGSIAQLLNAQLLDADRKGEV